MRLSPREHGMIMRWGRQIARRDDHFHANRVRLVAESTVLSYRQANEFPGPTTKWWRIRHDLSSGMRAMRRMGRGCRRVESCSGTRFMQPREVVVRWAGTRHPWSLDKRSRKNGTPGDAQGGRGEAFPSAAWSGLGRRRLHEVQVRFGERE